MKVIEKIEGPLSSDDGRVVFSFEFCTPKPGQSPEGFVGTVSRMAAHGPAFCDITWRPQGEYPDLTLALAPRMQSEAGVDTMMHLTCVGMPLDAIDRALATARARGLRNILALRGDLPKGHDSVADSGGGLDCALDLVRHIRATHGDYFGIGVAGYPEAHPCKIPEGSKVATHEGYESDLQYLKEKVEAGADLIITQLFFDTELFLKFVKDCRRVGITCPIVPGILPITTYRNYKFMTTTCKTMIPPKVREAVEARKADETKLSAFGVELATEMCRTMLAAGVRALHFYTMNREEPAVAVLKNLGLLGGAEILKPLAVHQNGKRSEEEERAGSKRANGLVNGSAIEFVSVL